MTYQSMVLADTPLWYFRMETTSAFDEISAGNKFLTGTPTVGTGKWDNGWTGMTQNIAVSLGGTSTDFTSDNTWSVEAWFKLPASFTGDPTIWRRDGNGKACLIRAESSQSSKMRVYLNGTSMYSTVGYNDNAWHHMVFTVSGTAAGSWKLYIDASNVASLTNPGSLTLSDGAGVHALCASNVGMPGNGEGWQGSLDEVALYDYALTSTQISNHYNNAAPAAFKGWGIPFK